MENRIWIGLDIGAVSVQLAVLFEMGTQDSLYARVRKQAGKTAPSPVCLPANETARIVLSPYIRHQGNPDEAIRRFLEPLIRIIPAERFGGICATGSGARHLKSRDGIQYASAFRATARSVSELFPDVRTVFEMGGERSRYMLLSDGSRSTVQIIDYEMNGECAAGTGAFFDQQVERLKCRVEDVGEIVKEAKRTAAIAGRCSVFAKSDMIHAQQRGYSPPEVLKGLCEAVVRNFKGSVTKGKTIRPAVALLGGVAANGGVVQAFRDVFDFRDGDLIVPPAYAWMGAIGAALIGKDNRKEAEPGGISTIQARHAYPTTTPLSLEKVRLLRNQARTSTLPEGRKTGAYLGIDVGSVSTNLALIDENGDLIYGIYRMTDGRPIQVVEDSLKEMSAAVGDRVEILGAGTTGSGRELIGSLVGADVVKDEITAHKTGALHVSGKYLRKPVDTIFEIGGQDSKFISIRDGVVVDFSLNEACAAGTGSFLEEQATQMGIAIKEEFARLALASDHPLKLGERCTVFMEKELVPYLQQGVPREDITAGLALSVVQNYLNRVVKKRAIGEYIFFQGGTAYNDSVAAAFATVLGKPVTVPPHNGIMGAIGAALLAQCTGKASSFRGWDLSTVERTLREFTCQGCSNNCRIQEFNVQGEKSYWGDKCSDRYRKRARSSRTPCLTDLMALNESLLFPEEDSGPGPRGSIGLPRALFFFDRMVFWRTYFLGLGFQVVVSGPTRQRLIQMGVEAAVAEPCFPVQAAHGHLLDLASLRPDYIFLPNVVNEEDPTGSVASFICPWAQTIPLVVRHTPALDAVNDRILAPNIQFREGPGFVEAQLRRAMRPLGIGSGENRRAVQAAYKAQTRFCREREEAGRNALKRLQGRSAPAVVLVGRPYNLYDPGLNLNIPGKLRNLYGMDVIPLDFLPVRDVDIRHVHDHMFWNYGRRILQACCLIRDYPDLHLIYLSNFKCGPDSYIRHYVEEAAWKPFLFLQLDSHANDAGIMTRIEAFLESKELL
jgi:predicted CoA-substrate-specific enzyme activase